MSTEATIRPVLGFIGLGAMGGPMCRNLVKAGYSVTCFDIDPARVAACVDAGATRAGSSPEVVEGAEIVLTSLRSSAIWVQVAETDLVPNARAGQVFIDLGTVAPPETRRLAQAFREKGAWPIDSPVSGGPHGSETGTLRMFVGGEEEVVRRCRPILEVLGEPQRVVYCGPSGAGQVVKGVNQLAMGLADAAYLEAIAFGVRAGVDPAAIRQAVGGDEGWRNHFAMLAQRVADGKAEHSWVKFPELPYFLSEAAERATALPLTQALFEFCDAGDKSYADNMGRQTVSFWAELINR
jgi:3-hydroxyisobutyrate dehydrogenase-like beta-hydroxyacid dehydrogenase